MIASEKSHQNLSEYNHSQEKWFQVNKKQILSSEIMINSGNCIYDYAHSFLGKVF